MPSHAIQIATRGVIGSNAGQSLTTRGFLSYTVEIVEVPLPSGGVHHKIIFPKYPKIPCKAVKIIVMAYGKRFEKTVIVDACVDVTAENVLVQETANNSITIEVIGIATL